MSWFDDVTNASNYILPGIAPTLNLAGGVASDNNPLSFGGNSNQPSNYNSGPDAQGFGGPGEIAGNGQVPYGSLNLPYFQQDRARLQGLMGGQSPFASKDWGDLIGQLKQRASGQGPSLAQQNYNMAAGDTTNALSSMARGSANPDAARQALIQQGRIGQGQAAGLALAGTQEQQAAQQGLTGAIGARDQLNQGAYMGLQQQLAGMNMGQLNALQSNQNYNTANKQIDAQQQAAKMEALASILAAGGKIAGGGK